jgi:predicted AlkP superfamily phosphohydrolase/phosphomutase
MPSHPASRKVFVFGLDCAPPSILFDPTLNLPNLQRLMRQGRYGPLESITPCITVPAWACMMSGKDPGELGVYGFRNRADRSYTNLALATSASINAEMVWDTLGKRGLRSILFGVPPSYPPKPVHGSRVGCFLTPGPESPYTWPPELKPALEAQFGPYKMDAVGFRTEDKADLLRQIYEMTAQHTRMVKHLITTQPWDFGMWVEIGTDRMHHGFWRWHDPAHRKHEPNHPFNSAIRDYYEWLDRQIGEVLALLPDGCSVMVVSDHGADRMDGGICINEWLIREGFLTLDQPMPASPTPLNKLKVDWSRTTAWGEGGYYGRVFINVQGREPAGTVSPDDYERVRLDLAARIAAIPDEGGRALKTSCFTPEALYRQVNGIAPDLLVYFDDLLWRSIGTVGHGSMHVLDNDSGPDDCNHAMRGIVICSPEIGLPALPARIIDVAGFVQSLFQE